jgi:hypothetical protein
MEEGVKVNAAPRGWRERLTLTPTKLFICEGSADGFDLRLEIATAWGETARLSVNGVAVAESGYSGIFRPHLAADVATSQGTVSVSATISRGGLYRNLRDAASWCTMRWNAKPVSIRVVRAPWLSAQPRRVRVLALTSVVVVTGLLAFFFPKDNGLIPAVFLLLLYAGRIPRDIRPSAD